MKQNILLITADQMRHDAMGFHGVFPPCTPHLDALAAGGTVFDQAYTSNPLCVPARASIMTGLHSFRSGVYYNDQPWAEGVETLPGVLADNGYYTLQIGKTHFRPKRRHGGFVKNITPEDYSAAMVKKYGPGSRKSPPASTWDDMVISHYQRRWDGSYEPEDYEPIYYTTRAIRELDLLVERRQCTGDADEPFFLWWSSTRPHSPCAPPPPYDTLFRPEDLPPPIKTAEEKETFSTSLRNFGKGWEALTPELIADFRARYLGDVAIVDAQIGRLLAHLEHLGLRENTLVIFTSDHGDYLGDHHQMQKGFFHDASSRVPFLFNGPGVEKGARVTAGVSLCDLKPTVLDFCDLLMPSVRDANGTCIYNQVAGEDTLSLLPALRGRELPADRVVLAETGIYGQGMMAKRGHEKINYYPQTKEFDFFDLAADPNELNNRGGELTFATLPEWARVEFEKILIHTEPMKGKPYTYDGKWFPTFS